MKELDIDFAKCSFEFHENIALARRAALELFNKELVDAASFNDKIASVYESGGFQNSLRQQEQLLGVISSFEKVSQSTEELCKALSYLINYYQNTAVARYLGYAKSALRKSWEIKEIENKVFDTRSGYTIASPVLKSIKCQDQTLQFMYQKRKNKYEGKYLTGIQLLGMDRGVSESAYLSYNPYNLLSKLNIYGRCSPDYYLFSYLNENSPLGKKSENIPETGTQNYLLQKIKTSLGKEIELTYRIFLRDSLIFRLFGRVCLTGITIHDGGITDSIKYNYQQPVCVFDSIYNRDVLDYGIFSDNVRKTEWNYVGSACVKTGNDGFFFSYVEEEWVGKGRCSYLFFTPKPPKLKNTSLEKSFFLYSLCGLPLGKAIYDQGGNLIQLEKYKYQTNIDLSDYPSGEKWFEYLEDTPISSIVQIKENPYYMNTDEIRTYYGNQKRIFLFDGEYLQPMQFYYYNYEPRVSPLNIPNKAYRLLYNTKTLLKSSKILHFNGHISDKSSPDHFTAEWQSGFMANDIEYRYRHISNAAYPEQIVTHLTNGDERIQIIKRPLDFVPGADPVIDCMKENHIFSPEIKKQIFLKKRGESGYHLLAETINQYQDSVLQSGEKKFFLVAGYSRVNKVGQVDLNRIQDNQLFSGAPEEYRMVSGWEYKRQREGYVPVKEFSMSDTTLYYYEPTRNNIILTVKGERPEGIAIYDNYQEKEIHDYAQEIQPYLSAYEAFKDFLRADSLKLKHGMYRDVFSYFLRSEKYKYCVRSLRTFVNLPNYATVWPLIREIGNFMEEDNPFRDLSMQYELLPDLDKCIPREIASAMIEAIDRFEFIEEKQYEYLVRVLHNEVIKPDSTNSINVKGANLNQKMDVTFLFRPDVTSLSVEYIIDQGGQQIVKREEISGLTPRQFQLVKFSIDLSVCEAPQSLTIRLPINGKLRSALVIPAGIEYEAKSYNGANRVAYKFDSCGQLESYRYEHGMIKAVSDKDGQLIQEKQYKFSEL